MHAFMMIPESAALDLNGKDNNGNSVNDVNTAATGNDEPLLLRPAFRSLQEPPQMRPIGGGNEDGKVSNDLERPAIISKKAVSEGTAVDNMRRNLHRENTMPRANGRRRQGRPKASNQITAGVASVLLSPSERSAWAEGGEAEEEFLTPALRRPSTTEDEFSIKAAAAAAAAAVVAASGSGAAATTNASTRDSAASPALSPVRVRPTAPAGGGGGGTNRRMSKPTRQASNTNSSDAPTMPSRANGKANQVANQLSGAEAAAFVTEQYEQEKAQKQQASSRRGNVSSSSLAMIDEVDRDLGSSSPHRDRNHTLSRSNRNDAAVQSMPSDFFSSSSVSPQKRSPRRNRRASDNWAEAPLAPIRPGGAIGSTHPNKCSSDTGDDELVAPVSPVPPSSVSASISATTTSSSASSLHVPSAGLPLENDVQNLSAEKGGPPSLCRGTSSGGDGMMAAPRRAVSTKRTSDGDC